METILGNTVSVASISTAAGPLAAVGVGLALTFVLAPKAAKRAIHFIKSIF